MALRAIGKKRPELLPEVVELAERLSTSEVAAARRVGRPIARAFEGEG